jgi:hypothetical protein
VETRLVRGLGPPGFPMSREFQTVWHNSSTAPYA